MPNQSIGGGVMIDAEGLPIIPPKVQYIFDR